MKWPEAWDLMVNHGKMIASVRWNTTTYIYFNKERCMILGNDDDYYDISIDEEFDKWIEYIETENKDGSN